MSAGRALAASQYSQSSPLLSPPMTQSFGLPQTGLRSPPGSAPRKQPDPQPGHEG